MSNVFASIKGLFTNACQCWRELDLLQIRAPLESIGSNRLDIFRDFQIHKRCFALECRVGDSCDSVSIFTYQECAGNGDIIIFTGCTNQRCRLGTSQIIIGQLINSYLRPLAFIVVCKFFPSVLCLIRTSSTNRHIDSCCRPDFRREHIFTDNKQFCSGYSTCHGLNLLTLIKGIITNRCKRWRQYHRLQVRTLLEGIHPNGHNTFRNRQVYEWRVAVECRFVYRCHFHSGSWYYRRNHQTSIRCITLDQRSRRSSTGIDISDIVMCYLYPITFNHIRKITPSWSCLINLSLSFWYIQSRTGIGKYCRGNRKKITNLALNVC